LRAKPPPWPAAMSASSMAGIPVPSPGPSTRTIASLKSRSEPEVWSSHATSRLPSSPRPLGVRTAPLGLSRLPSSSSTKSEAWRTCPATGPRSSGSARNRSGTGSPTPSSGATAMSLSPMPPPSPSLPSIACSPRRASSPSGPARGARRWTAATRCLGPWLGVNPRRPGAPAVLAMTAVHGRVRRMISPSASALAAISALVARTSLPVGSWSRSRRRDKGTPIAGDVPAVAEHNAVERARGVEGPFGPAEVLVRALILQLRLSERLA
jgi:hypothetical protein